MSNSNDYRKRTQRKSMITTIISGVVIVAAAAAIIFVIVAMINNGSSDSAASSPDSASATVQPTLYQNGQGGLTPSELPTQQAGTTQATAPAPATTAPQPTQAGPTAPRATEAPRQTPTEPDTQDQPAEPVDNTGTGRLREEAPLNAYTDGSGVLHVITPAGYNWTYQCDGEHVSVTCDPHDGQYEFLITGIAPGKTDVTPQYFVREDKKAWVAVPVYVNVDADLRVTVIG